jgi:hypothetical protein
MSFKSDVNAHTGYFPYPWEAPEPTSIISKRLQVHDADLEPDLNPGAMYFVEGHYIMADEAAAGTHDNNASYRPATVTETSPNVFFTDVTGVCQWAQPGIRAWADYEFGVVETDVRVPNEGLLLLAAKSTDLGGGFWHYEYAVQNLNSDRSVGSFSVPIPPGATVQEIGFHDVDYHSGEIYALTDWPGSVSDNTVTWSTVPYGTNPNANALRYATLYNFRFDADVEPGTTTVTFGLFKPGFPTWVDASTIGPAVVRSPLPEDSIKMTCTTQAECGGEADCVQGVCYVPKHRYLSVVRNPDQVSNTARRVCIGEECLGWIGAPYESAGLWLATVTPTPVYANIDFVGDWPDLLHVTGCEIATEQTYTIQAIRVGHDLGDPASYSEGLELHTPSRWGDVVAVCPDDACQPPQGTVNLDDIMAGIVRFQGVNNAPLTWLDIDPSSGTSIPNQIVGLQDILSCVAGFQGRPYPGDGPFGCGE